MIGMVNIRDWDRCHQCCYIESELTDGNPPSGVLESQVKHDLRGDTVDRTVEEPSLNSKCEDRQGEVWGSFEENMCDQAITSSPPLIQAEADQHRKANT
jgi:hypothetical protein